MLTMVSASTDKIQNCIGDTERERERGEESSRNVCVFENLKLQKCANVAGQKDLEYLYTASSNVYMACESH